RGTRLHVGVGQRAPVHRVPEEAAEQVAPHPARRRRGAPGEGSSDLHRPDASSPGSEAFSFAASRLSFYLDRAPTEGLPSNPVWETVPPLSSRGSGVPPSFREPTMLHLVRVPLALVLLVALTGCGDSANRQEVTGEVRIKGQPVADGVIQFNPVDGQSTGDG